MVSGEESLSSWGTRLEGMTGSIPGVRLSVEGELVPQVIQFMRPVVLSLEHPFMQPWHSEARFHGIPADGFVMVEQAQAV